MPEASAAHRAAIALFAKPPRPGLSKTRLAADLGPARAAALARALLLDGWAAAQHFPSVLAGLATTVPFDDPPLAPSRWWLQGDGDLGRRIVRVLQQALEDAPIAIALGADVPCLPAERIEAALSALEARACDVVLGPAEDGGFYLLALRECPDDLLDDLPWSVDRTCAATLARLRERGLRVEVVDPWFDVDESHDLDRLAARIAEAPDLAPALRTEMTALDWPPTRPHLSAIVPVLNEAARIEGQLRHLLSFDGVGEIVVVDGGSSDVTRAIVQAVQDSTEPLRVRLVDAPRGRARQLNAGAAAARGNRLIFVHADTVLPERADRTVDEVLARPGVVAGAFRTWTVDDDPDAEPTLGRRVLRPLLHLADFRSRYTDLPYGDQAPFMSALTFRAVGGFPEIPLMEDLEFSLRLRRLGRIETARTAVRVSGRRFLDRPIFYTALVNIYPALYRLGVPPETLARWYRHVR